MYMNIFPSKYEIFLYEIILPIFLYSTTSISQLGVTDLISRFSFSKASCQVITNIVDII